MTDHSHSNRGLVLQLSLYTLYLLLLVAPLFRSGKTPLAILSLELLALLGLVLYFWGGRRFQGLSHAEKWLLGAMLALPLLHLIPLPGISRLSLPGQADYYTNLQLAGYKGLATFSILPRETLLAWLALLVPVTVFLLTRAMPVQRLHPMIVVVLAMATAQAILGLLQYGAGPGSVFMLGMDQEGGLAKGTWRGRNNYANFLDMALMISLALFMATLGRSKQATGDQSLKERLIYLSTMHGHKAFIFGVVSVLLLLAVVFSRSRAGIGLAMVGIVLTGIMYAQRVGGNNAYGMVGRVLSVSLAFGIAIGLGPVWQRFSQTDPLSDGRWTTFASVWEGVTQFFPLGAGIGTFQQTYMPFQDLNQAMYTINRAHNSYLEWLYTGGILAALLILFALLLYISRWFKVWKKEAWGDFRYIQVGAGTAMLITLMHEMVDFNLFVPANMVYFAFFAGIFFHPYDEPAPRPKQRQRGTRVIPDQRSRPALQPVPGGDAKNPFMD